MKATASASLALLATLLLGSIWPIYTRATDLDSDQLLNDYHSNPLGVVEQAGNFCKDTAHSNTPICMAMDDFNDWSGAYRNEKVSVVPADLVPALPEKAQLYSADRTIPALIGSSPVVMINEVHDHPETRILSYALLKPLATKGFRILALEALSDTATDDHGIGFPAYVDGYYVRDPIYADLIRQAISLGYTVVPYDNGMNGSIADRELAQAKKLAAIVSAHPNEKMIVLGGMAHVYKAKGSYLQGNEPMAMKFSQAAGIVPFVIDQLYTFDAAIPSAITTNKEGLYLAMSNGHVWSAEPTQFDVSIIARINRDQPARKAWGDLFGLRHPLHVQTPKCVTNSCIVQARAAGAPEDSVPTDAVILGKGTEEATLYVPSGGYNVVVRDSSGRTIDSRNVRVN